MFRPGRTLEHILFALKTNQGKRHFLSPNLRKKISSVLKKFQLFYKNKHLSPQELTILQKDIKDLITSLRNNLRSKPLTKDQREQVETTIKQLEAAEETVIKGLAEKQTAKTKQQNKQPIKTNHPATPKTQTLPKAQAIKTQQTSLPRERVQAIEIKTVRSSKTQVAAKILLPLLKALIGQTIAKTIRPQTRPGERLIPWETKANPATKLPAAIKTFIAANPKVAAEINIEVQSTSTAKAETTTINQPEIKVKSQPATEQSKSPAKTATNKPNQAPTTQQGKKPTFTVTVNEKTGAVKINTTDQVSEAKAEQVLTEVVTTMAKANLAQLITAVSQHVEAMPAAKAETLQIISEIMAETPPKKAETTKKITSQPKTESIVRTVINELSQATAESRPSQIEVTKTVLAKMPQAALPELISEHARLSETSPQVAAQVVEPLIAKLAQTKTGEIFVVNQFTQSKEATLLQSKVGQTIVTKAAENIAQRTKVKSSGKSSKPSPTRELVAQANSSLLSVLPLALTTATNFFRVVAATNRCLRAVSPKKNLAQTKTSQPTAPSRSAQKPTQQATILKAAKALTVKAASAQAKSINQLLTAAKTTGFVIPKAVINQVYTQVAAVRPNAQAKTNKANFAPRTPTRTSRNLANVRDIFTKEVNRAILGKDPSAWGKALKLSARTYLYAMIMRLVRGRIADVDYVIQELIRKGLLKDFITAVEESSQEKDGQEKEQKQKGQEQKDESEQLTLEEIDGELSNLILKLALEDTVQVGAIALAA